MSFTDINAALLGPIVDNAGFGLDFQYENRSKEPVNDVPFGRAFNLPVQPFDAALGRTCQRHDGVYQISIWYPEGKGTGEILNKADTIANAYYNTGELLYNTISVTVESVGISPAQNDNGWFKADISINYYAYVRR